jgi:hypothetical protein
LSNLTQPISGAQFASLDLIKTRMGEIAKIRETLVRHAGSAEGGNAENWMSSASTVLGDFVRDTYGLVARGDWENFKPQAQQRIRGEDRVKAEQHISQLYDEIGQKAEHVADIEKKRNTVGERAAKLAEIENRFAEIRGAITSDSGQSIFDRTRELKALKEQEQVERDEVNFRADAQMRELRLHERVSKIQAEGGDSALQSARAILNSAREEERLAQHRGEEEKAIAAAKVASAQSSVTMAEKERDLTTQRLALEMRVARLSTAGGGLSAIGGLNANEEGASVGATTRAGKMLPATQRRLTEIQLRKKDLEDRLNNPDPHLTVDSRQVIRSFGQSGGRRKRVQSRMWTVIVIVMKVVRKEVSSLLTGVIGASESPFAGDDLDEALSLAVGLWAIRFGKRMLEAKFSTRGSKESGTVGRAAVSEHTLNANAVLGIEAHSLLERMEHARDLLVRKKTGKAESGMIINGNMQAFDSRAAIAEGAIPSSTDTRLLEAA